MLQAGHAVPWAAQMRRIGPHFLLSHAVARVDDRRATNGIIFVIRNGLRWRDAPADPAARQTGAKGSKL